MARARIDQTIRYLVRKDIGATDQKIDSLETRIRTLHLQARAAAGPGCRPIGYRDRSTASSVNAQTGETSGEAPLSWWKVAGLVVLGLIFLYLWIISQ
jgi:hypothetical protein